MNDPHAPYSEAPGVPDTLGALDPSGAHAQAPPPPRCPAAHPDSVPLSGLEFQQTPSQLYRSLRREHGPVAPVLLDGGIPAWLVLGYSEVGYVTSHDELFARDSRRWNQWPHDPHRLAAAAVRRLPAVRAVHRGRRASAASRRHHPGAGGGRPVRTGARLAGRSPSS